MIKATSISDITARIIDDQRVYELLTKDERRIVDDFNLRIKGKSITEIIAMGDHPFIVFRQKYGEAK